MNNNIEVIKDEENCYIIKEKVDITTSYLMNYNENINLNLEYGNKVKLYNGKFKEEKRINWGASPGARASNEEIYFSKQRLYEIDQQIVADFLNFLRQKNGMSKKELTDLFPDNYKHTVGHWLRKDFGGSIPLPKDWDVLKKYLSINDAWTNYVCKCALKIQTVKKGEYKLPKDFIDISIINKLELLLK